MSANSNNQASEYGLFTAITEAQQLRTWEATSDEWGQPFMTVKEYMGRERAQYNTDFSGNKKKKTYWLYGKKADFEKDPTTLNFVSHAETYDRNALLKKANEAEVVDIVCKGIASVFCQNEHRGKGHAKAMMTELSKRLAEISGMSNLYSDVGDKFYSRLGWDLYPYVVAEIPTNSENNASITSASISTAVTLMDKTLARRFMEADAIVARKELEEAPVADHAKFMIVPTADTLDWRWTRDEYEGVQIMKRPEFPTNFGAFISNGTTADQLLNNIHDRPTSSLPSFIIWTPRFRKDKIRILRARFNSVDDIKPLVEAALAEANRLNLPKVVLWNPKKEFHAALQSQFDTQFVTLSDNLPSVATYFDSNKNSEWVLNENYCWN